MEANFRKINEYYKAQQFEILDLIKWVKENNEQRVILDKLLDLLELEKNEETRYVAYSRISWLRDSKLILFLDNNSFSQKIKI